jgi:hypothetical protein
MSPDTPPAPWVAPAALIALVLAPPPARAAESSWVYRKA